MRWNDIHPAVSRHRARRVLPCCGSTEESSAWPGATFSWLVHQVRASGSDIAPCRGCPAALMCSQRSIHCANTDDAFPHEFHVIEHILKAMFQFHFRMSWFLAVDLSDVTSTAHARHEQGWDLPRTSFFLKHSMQY